MFSIKNLKIAFIILLSGIAIQSTYSAEDPLNQELQNLFAMPDKVVATTEEGDTVESFVLSGSDNSVGTIKKKNGSIIQFSRTPAYGGGYNYSFTDSSGNKTTATQDKNGVVSGNGQEYVRAADKPVKEASKNSAECGEGKLCTITTEEVPGANCRCIDTKNSCKVVETRKYECATAKGLTGFQEVVAKIIRFVINIVLLLGVLAVVGLGIAWSFAGGDDVKMKSTIKTWGINIVIGLFIIFMFGYILRFLAPWVYL